MQMLRGNYQEGQVQEGQVQEGQRLRQHIEPQANHRNKMEIWCILSSLIVSWDNQGWMGWRGGRGGWDRWD